MAKGRKPKPASVLKLTGTYDQTPSRYANRAGAPPGLGPAIKRPTQLGPEETKVWNQVVKVLKELNTLDGADAQLIAIYCQTFVQYQTWSAEASRIGPSAANTLLPQARFLRDQLLKVMNELGLTPTARTRLAGPAQEDDPLAAHQAAGQA